ncbi:hypothetical protein OPV22_034109 [Ensete ventricosum]|uniref:Proteasome component Ecm29 N-terminal domain-containing protein n=1 Tax=Ensete ventricosum TaxID=4639 RepID=A0AAV8PW39_ENSVE|nr:hypothetical protein OPV22_034109 [Ensete ventricosum]
MKPAAAGSSHRLLEIQMAQRRLPFFFLLIVALAVFSTLLGGAPVRAEIVLLMVKCREYVAPGPRKDPSKECCADEVQKADVVCFCKNIPSAVEKKISMEEPNAENFCIVYIQMSFDRLDGEDKSARAPDLLVNIAKGPPQHQEVILRIVAQVIGENYSSQDSEKVGTVYRAIGNSEDGQVFLEFCLDTLLYQPPSPVNGCLAGLSIAQSDPVTGNLPLKSDMLMLRKATRAFVTVRPLRTHDPRGRRVYMKPAAAGSSHRLLEIQMAQCRLPFFFFLIVALAVFSTLLGGAPVRAELVLLMVKCREYVVPGPLKDPSKECCADVVCLCKNIPSAVETKISMENAVNMMLSPLFSVLTCTKNSNAKP